MKKIKWLVAFLIVANLLLGVIGCKDPEIHIHTYSEAWTSDEENHWHEATCEHTTEVSGKEAHTFGEWTVTKEPTEEAEGSREKSCTVCEYTVPEEIAKLEHTHKFAESLTKDASGHWYECVCGAKKDFEEHTYDIGKVVQEPSCTQEGKKTVYCTVCEYEKEETIPAKGHSRIWEITNEPTETAVGQMKSVCEVCGETVTKELQQAPEGFRFVNGGTITGTESWTPSSIVFASGRSLTIPDLIVSDHEVTRGEYKDVMGSDPSDASSYDKDGKELEGEAVLNNPVNNVNWYDALVYCNKLSMQENLTPCYSIDGLIDPDAWGEVPTSRYSTWDVAICDFEADGYRLPTEAEWEWLARGGENYEYAGSDTIVDVAWYKSNTTDKGTRGTREVKTKAPNGYGLYDMSGNVQEWCWDRFGGISSSSASDGSTSGNLRVQRGGSLYSIDIYCWVNNRARRYPGVRSDDFGFRVVRLAN